MALGAAWEICRFCEQPYSEPRWSLKEVLAQPKRRAKLTIWLLGQFFSTLSFTCVRRCAVSSRQRWIWFLKCRPVARCSGAAVWKPLQASRRKIMLTFSNWRKWEGKPDRGAKCKVWWCLRWWALQQKKGIFRVAASVIANEKRRWLQSSGTISLQKFVTCCKSKVNSLAFFPLNLHS